MSERTRYYSFIGYEEKHGEPTKWREYIDENQICCAISPIHTSDEKESTKHYHINIDFGSLKSEQQMISLCEKATFSRVKAITNKVGADRYLIHLDNPNKEQFPLGEKAIECKYGYTLDLGKEQKKQDTDRETCTTFKSIIDIIENNDIHTMKELANVCMTTQSFKELAYVINHAYLIIQILKEND